MSAGSSAAAAAPVKDALPRIGAPAPTRKASPRYVWLAVAFVMVFAVLGGYLFEKAGSKVAVVVVTAPVSAGHTISRTDVSTESVAGVTGGWPAAGINDVVGKTASVGLVPGQVMLPAMFGSSNALPPGKAQVGMLIKGGGLPADGLVPGDTVEIVQLPPASPVAGQPTTPQVLVAAAQVFSARADSAGSDSTLVTAVVPSANAPAVAAAAGAGLVALVKVPAS